MARNRFSSEEELNPLFGDHMRAEQEIKPWDVFEDPPIRIETGSMEESKWIDFSVKIFKLLAYFTTFVIVLGSAVISKGTLLFMTSQITLNQTKPYCNKDLDTNQQFIVKLPSVERVAWIWILVFTFFAVELGTFIRSLRICLFKTWSTPTKGESFTFFVTESLPTIGSAILVFCILPDLDVVKGAMLTNAVCFVPAVVGFFSRNPEDSTNITKMVLDITSIIAQATAFVVWPMVENQASLWLIPVSVILISCGWWENYVSENSPIKFIKKLGKTKKNYENSRYFAYMFLSLWKCLLFFITLLIIVWVNEGSVDFLFDEFSAAFEVHDIHVMEVKPIIGEESSFDIREVIETGGSRMIPSHNLAPVWVFLINIIASYLTYIFGKFACKISIQGFSYAFPVNLTVPVTISLLIAMCGIYNGNDCEFYGHIPAYLFFNSPPVYYLHDFIASEHSWIWLLWLLSQTWITIHIWTPHCERLARTEKLYVRPMYDAFLIDQSIAMNRRRDDRPETLEEDDVDYDDEEDTRPQTTSSNRNEITRIYACGTMWHESKEEMAEFLKSIMRLDEDQCARRIVREELGIIMSDYYEIETHVFFDDAFQRVSKEDNDPRVNKHVKDLALAIDDAATKVHQTHIRIRPPKKSSTPYGGRLVWTLPGKTKLYVHLKDKKKIRPKKRWSQVMYMYYLLGHRLMERSDLSPKRKAVIAENTYLLALDGDIDFQPEAVHLLVDLMKKNKTLGAACGRIHPTGSGPMVWYQMFEYAVGHWLQKATEHMIGCVLCSPGCFSLFRATGLMDDSVMKKYTTVSKEARHYVQYDQGEDRWLCTLLLQMGYRVEYSAASDAFTHCPEGFNEFYNQRRRWIPSTTANILDLLMAYKRTIKINDNISRLYILYQIVLMVGTVLGPGTIFLMLVGSFVAAFQMDQWSSFVWNAVPILVFMVICLLFKSKVQLFFAGVISAIYGLVMMAVLVGVMLQITSDGILAPSSLFFFIVAGEMIVTGLLHPKEIGCLPYGIVYYVTVPSMYMLLVIYAVFNLNDISWGTRDVTVVPKANPEELQTKEAEEKKSKETKAKESPNKILAFFGNGKNEENSGTLEFSIAGLMKCMLCTHRKTDDENVQLVRISDDLKRLTAKLDVIERVVRHQPDIEIERQSQQKTGPTHLEGSKGTNVTQPQDDEYEIYASDRKSQISDVLEPNNWMEEGDLGRGGYDTIPTNERIFWEGLLDKYLHPIEDDKEKVAGDLKDLRDKSVMAFFMINALFVLVVFLLTLKKDMLHINWPFGVKVNFTYLDDVAEIEIYKQYLELEPIGFVFLIFFATLLVVQFIGMLFHRFATFSQILATTYINWGFCTKLDKKNLTEEQILENDPVKIVKQLFKIRGVEDDDEEEIEEPAVGRRKTVKHLAESVKHLTESGHKKHSVNDLFEAFERRTTKLFQKNNNGTSVVGRKSMAAIVHQRRSTVHNLRRASQMQPRLPSNNLGRSYINNGYEETESPL